jgi:hypothetical protein
MRVTILILIIRPQKDEAMAITTDTIDHVTLERLVEAGAIRGANDDEDDTGSP